MEKNLIGLIEAASEAGDSELLGFIEFAIGCLQKDVSSQEVVFVYLQKEKQPLL